MMTMKSSIRGDKSCKMVLDFSITIAVKSLWGGSKALVGTMNGWLAYLAV